MSTSIGTIVHNESPRRHSRIGSFIKTVHVQVRRLKILRPRFPGRKPASLAKSRGELAQSGESRDPIKAKENISSNLESIGTPGQDSSYEGPMGREIDPPRSVESVSTPVRPNTNGQASIASLDTAGDLGRLLSVDACIVAQEETGEPAIPKSHPSDTTLAGATFGKANRGSSRLVPAGLRGARARWQETHVLRSLSEKRHTKKVQHIAIGSQIQLNSNPPDEGSSHSRMTQPDADAGRHELLDVKEMDKVTTELEELEQLRRDLSNSRSLIAELQKRCEAQSRDLKNSNNFLNTADKSSDLDIILTLQRLNAEVQQTTTHMTDSLVEDFKFGSLLAASTKDQSFFVQRVSDHIGQVLANSLGMMKPEDIQMLLQIAFQACITSSLCQTAFSWSFEPGHNTFIDKIYQCLRGAEPQAISGRWRSLARIYIAHAWIAHPETLVSGIVSGISDILLAAGCTVPQSVIMSTVTSKFGHRLALLVGLAGRLNKMFDDVISSDFEVFVARPGEKFEDKSMEDTDSDEVGIQQGSVLCATHLGLIKQIPVGALWDRGKKQKMMVLKTKVLLESFLVSAGD